MRPLVAMIRLERLRHNYLLAKLQHGKKVLAVLKADAYGHKAVPCAQALQDIVDGFAVACLEEALQLRAAGIVRPILLLEGVFHPSELLEVEQHRLWIVVHSEEQICMLEQATPKQPYSVWLMLDTGMHREGLIPEAYKQGWSRLKTCPNIASIIKMTHFSHADEVHTGITEQQILYFDQVVAGLPGEESLSNSAALFCFTKASRDWGRLGIGLYGAMPCPMPAQVSGQLKPVMRLTAQVLAVRHLEAGESIGYGGCFVTQHRTRVGLVACGYADGYPRCVNSATPVLVAGQRTQIIGRISMDMITVDLTGIPAADVGSEVELWGDTVCVNEVAQCAATISYELLCNIKRAHFVFTDWQAATVPSMEAPAIGQQSIV